MRPPGTWKTLARADAINISGWPSIDNSRNDFFAGEKTGFELERARFLAAISFVINGLL
jgi:hypothetical protein